MGFVTFTNGPTLPMEAWLLAVDLELRSLRLVAEGATLRVVAQSGKPDLSSEERESIKKWKMHLLVLVSYCSIDH